MSLVCVVEGVLATVVLALAFGLAPFELASLGLALVGAVLAAFWLELELVVVVLAVVGGCGG